MCAGNISVSWQHCPEKAFCLTRWALTSHLEQLRVQLVAHDLLLSEHFSQASCLLGHSDFASLQLLEDLLGFSLHHVQMEVLLLMEI